MENQEMSSVYEGQEPSRETLEKMVADAEKSNQTLKELMEVAK